MAVTVAVFLFAAQILGTGATVDGFASVNLASERFLAEVDQLSRHVLSVSQAARASLRANVGKESRRLAKATTYCAWSLLGGASTCRQNDAWATAQLSTVSNPMIKSMATRAIKCAAFLTQPACQEGNCKWDSGACDITMSDSEGEAMLGLFFPKKGCGVIGTMMQLQAKCSVPGVCKLADGCEAKTERAPSDDGKTCKSKSTCKPTDAANNAAMCPGPDTTDAIIKACSAEATAAGIKTAEAATAMITACYSRKCPFMGQVLAAMVGPSATCAAMSKSACSSNSQCKYVAAVGGGKCEADSGRLVAGLIPAGCPFKPIMDLTMKCPADASKAKCEKESACLLEKTLKCDAGCSTSTAMYNNMTCGPIRKEECTTTSTAMSTAMAKGTTDKDVKLFAAMAQQQEQCVAMKTQETCTGSSKGKKAPVFPTVVTTAASGSTQFVTSGLLLWAFFASLVGAQA